MLKASLLVGGSQALVMFSNLVRSKVVAVLLGPAGVGLLGTYTVISELIWHLSGLGIKSSGVREIAHARGVDNGEGVAVAAVTLRRGTWVTGILGAGLLMVAAFPIGRYTFGSDDHTLQLVALAPAVLFMTLHGGQIALIQGMRRVADLARAKIFGTVLGTLLCIPAYLLWGVDGIVPAIVILAGTRMVVTWRYARKVDIPRIVMTWERTLRESGGLVRLGIALMWSSLIAAGVGYLTRAFIARDIGMAGVGLYQAAFSLSGMFMNFVLKAMGADFYPALTSVADNDSEMNRMVNGQLEIGLLLTVPGLMATIVLAPGVVTLFYAPEFAPAAELLRWFVFGCLGRVLSWPLGYILLAKGRGRQYFWTEALDGVLQLTLMWGGLTALGLKGVAAAFVVMNIAYLGVMLTVARRVTGFVWSGRVHGLLAVLLPCAVATSLSTSLLSPGYGALAGGVLTLCIGAYCIRGVGLRLGREHRLCRMITRLPGGRLLLR
jgi:PST family polysaccharide transporter